jgi:hypothetical protein
MVTGGGGVIQDFDFEFLKGSAVGIRYRSGSEDNAATLGTHGEEKRRRRGAMTDDGTNERERGGDGWRLGMRVFTGRGGAKGRAGRAHLIGQRGKRNGKGLKVGLDCSGYWDK